MRLLAVMIVLVSVGGAGALPVDTTQRTIRQNAAAFRVCYQRELEKDPNVAGGGKIVLAVEVNKTGVVSSVRIESTTLNNKNVENCLVRTMLKLKFPPADAPVTFKFPFLFSSGS